MTKEDQSKRSFFKKVAATVGFFSASGYISKLIYSRTNSIQLINDNSANYVKKQKNAWLQKQWVPMTENEKTQMLDEILEIHNKSEA